MNTYDVLLKGHEDVAAGTMAFRFTKPPGFVFKPGQAITLFLTDPPPEPNSRQRIFSLVSAPFEAQLAVATRMREGSAFKRALKSLPPGAKLELKGPRGVMICAPTAGRRTRRFSPSCRTCNGKTATSTCWRG